MIQNLVDGFLVGSILSLGAIGLTMIMHMLRFANFSHAELLSIGAYATLVIWANFIKEHAFELLESVPATFVGFLLIIVVSRATRRSPDSG